VSVSTLNLAIDQRVGRLTLNRPECGNLITSEMMKTLRDHLRDASGALDILVIDSAGSDFTRGRDLQDRDSGLTREESLALAVGVNGALAALDAVVIAAVRGHALGFGCGLAVQSDLVVASETAVFGFDEMAHGFPPMIVMSYLGRYLLPKHALDLIITHREIGAREAASLGIVTQVVGDAELEASTRGLVSQLSVNVSAAKRAKQYLREIEKVEPESRPQYALRAQLEWFRRGTEA
jgi:enoyl-CoA hydratase/carnithine racemase